MRFAEERLFQNVQRTNEIYNGKLNQTVLGIFYNMYRTRWLNHKAKLNQSVRTRMYKINCICCKIKLIKLTKQSVFQKVQGQPEILSVLLSSPAAIFGLLASRNIQPLFWGKYSCIVNRTGFSSLHLYRNKTFRDHYSSLFEDKFQTQQHQQMRK